MVRAELHVPPLFFCYNSFSICFSSLIRSLVKLRMPSANFSVAMAFSFIIQLFRQCTLCGFQFIEQLRRNGEQIAACQFTDLTNISEACAHHLSWITKSLVIIKDPGQRNHTRVLHCRQVFHADIFFVPIEDPSHERGN